MSSGSRVAMWIVVRLAAKFLGPSGQVLPVPTPRGSAIGGRLRGYYWTSLRAITAQAGVDPALVRHFFGDKKGLFEEAVLQQKLFAQERLDRSQDNEQDKEVRLVEAYLDVWEIEPGASRVRALLRAAVESEENRQYFQEAFNEMYSRSAQALGPNLQPDALALAGAQLLGTCVIRYILRLEPIASMPRDELVNSLVPAVQYLLTTQPTNTERLDGQDA